MDTLKLKKAWEVALAPVKNLPMTAIMMYMSGNSLQIFSIMMVFMAFKNPIVGLVAVNQAFERFETDTNRAKIVQVKLAYLAMQLLALALGVWKVNSMGLLPCVTPCPRRARAGFNADTWQQHHDVGLVGVGGATRAAGIRSSWIVDRKYTARLHDSRAVTVAWLPRPCLRLAYLGILKRSSRPVEQA